MMECLFELSLRHLTHSQIAKSRGRRELCGQHQKVLFCAVVMTRYERLRAEAAQFLSGLVKSRREFAEYDDRQDQDGKDYGFHGVVPWGRVRRLANCFNEGKSGRGNC